MMLSVFGSKSRLGQIIALTQILLFVYGRLSRDSLLDMQAWLAAAGLTATQFPAERLVNYAYADRAVEKLGPFALERRDSKLPGCR